MKKTIIYVLMVLALGLVVYNATLVDYQNPLVGDSMVAVIGVFAALCAMVLLLIYLVSKKIQEKVEG